MKHLRQIPLFVAFSLWLILSNSTFAALPPQVNGQNLPTLAPMLEKVTPAVVNIAAIGEIQVRQRNSLLNDPVFRHFFDLPSNTQTKKFRSLGSGVIVDAKNGYLISNHHVIADAKTIIVNFKDGRQMEAKLIGSDPRTDVAILQIPAKGLTAVPLSNSDKLRVGDFAVAIGNPFGLGQTVTSGIVSALGRSGLGLSGKGSAQNFEEFIQTDAAINVGNSGGALVNLNGELIGINTAILSPNKGGNVGIGFAIPVNMAKTVMQQLIEHGEIQRGYFGVVVQTLTPELAEALQTNLTKGAIIASIEKDSPAEQSGLQLHDIVTSVNGSHVNNSAEMRNRIGLLNVGDNVSMVVHRGSEKLVLHTKITGDNGSGKIDGSEFDPRLAGAIFSDIPAESPLHDRVKGIYIYGIKQGAPAISAGLEPGDILVSINRKTVRNLQEAQQAFSGKQGQLLMNIQRGNTAFFLLVR
jgi:serine protease Do/serine protease DegQ